MTVLVIAAIFFATAFVLQLVLWRIWLPKMQILALLLLYLCVPIAMAASAYGFGFAPRLSAAEIARICVLYFPVSLAYIALYAAIELSSPTLLIVSYLAGKRGTGCGEAELLDHLRNKLEVAYRFELMENSGLIRMTSGVVEITPRGRFYGNLFEAASRLFGLQKGG
jgi:hypothetical protein